MSQQGAHAAPQYARLGEDAGRTHTAGSAAFAAPKARSEAGAKACTASGAASATARHRAERRSEAIATSCKSRLASLYVPHGWLLPRSEGLTVSWYCIAASSSSFLLEKKKKSSQFYRSRRGLSNTNQRLSHCYPQIGVQPSPTCLSTGRKSSTATTKQVIQQRQEQHIKCFQFCWSVNNKSVYSTAGPLNSDEPCKTIYPHSVQDSSCCAFCERFLVTLRLNPSSAARGPGRCECDRNVTSTVTNLIRRACRAHGLAPCRHFRRGRPVLCPSIPFLPGLFQGLMVDG